MSDDLVARLRAYKPDYREPDIQDLDCVEAAAALEAKDARIAELASRVTAAEANVDAFLAERDAALRRAEEAERDARRYRWLRAEHDRADPMARTVWKLNHDRNGSDWADVTGPIQLDAAIDAAIAEQEKP